MSILIFIYFIPLLCKKTVDINLFNLSKIMLILNLFFIKFILTHNSQLKAIEFIQQNLGSVKIKRNFI